MKPPSLLSDDAVNRISKWAMGLHLDVMRKQANLWRKAMAQTSGSFPQLTTKTRKPAKKGGKRGC